VVDVVAVPDRLEQPVGEPEGQDVLGRLLAQEVVDPEDLFLASVPKGFSITIRLFSTSPASASSCTTASAALGGTLR